MQNLAVTLIQRELAWENPADNRGQIESLLHELPDTGDLVVLPEMFTTGFSMNALANAEPEGGDTEVWMLNLARALDCAITGSIAVRAG
ncbi:MAG: amidohydrolase, partial [Halieaceae bacterium]|nr:amidohydrolase [Halieaceae bacterium]